MTSSFHDIDVGEPPVLLQKRRGLGVVGILTGLVVIAGLSGLLWMNYDRLVEASSKPAAAPVTASIADAEPSPSLADFQALQDLQKRTTEAWQSTGQLVDAQQAELKRLTEQVATLAARIEQLQQQATASAIPRLSEPPRPPAAGPRRQPVAAPRPSSPISLGGAPLPGAPPRPIR